MGRHNGKNINTNLSDKYSQKRFDHAKESTTGALKFILKRSILKTVEETDHLLK